MISQRRVCKFEGNQHFYDQVRNKADNINEGDNYLSSLATKIADFEALLAIENSTSIFGVDGLPIQMGSIVKNNGNERYKVSHYEWFCRGRF